MHFVSEKKENARPQLSRFWKHRVAAKCPFLGREFPRRTPMCVKVLVSMANCMLHQTNSGGGCGESQERLHQRSSIHTWLSN